MSDRIKGIIDAVSEIAMDYSARMERAKEQGFDWADGSSRESIDYINKAMRDGDSQAQAFSQYLSDNNIPYKPYVARTGSTYIDVLGDPYKLRDGGYSQTPLQYRFADHSKGKFGQGSYLGAKHIDSTMEADVFPGGNTLEQAIAKLEDTPGVRSRDAAFDPARRFDKNYLAGGAGLGILGAGAFGPNDASASPLSALNDAISLGDAFSDIMDERESKRGTGEYPSQALADYNRSQLLPSAGVIGQSLLDAFASGADYFDPLNLARLAVNPGGEGLVRFLDDPVVSTKRDALAPITDAPLLDQRDPLYDERLKEAQMVGGLLSAFSPF